MQYKILRFLNSKYLFYREYIQLKNNCIEYKHILSKSMQCDFFVDFERKSGLYNSEKYFYEVTFIHLYSYKHNCKNIIKRKCIYL